MLMALRAARPPAARARGNRAEYDDLRAATRAFGTAIRRSESAVPESRRFLCYALYSAELAACREISADMGAFRGRIPHGSERT